MSRNFLKIQIDIEDKDYARALARRFAELSNRLEILTYKSDEECDVLISDDNKYNGFMNVVYDCVLYFESYYKFVPARVLLAKVIKKYEDYNHTHFSVDANDLKIIYFSSSFGGSGTTSVSLTFARILAQMNYNTLFVSIDDMENYRLYLPIRHGPLKSKEELEYLLKFNRGTVLEEYLLKDKYGLDILPLPNRFCLPGIESIVLGTNRYKYLIVDCGRQGRGLRDSNSFYIVNYNDARTRLDSKAETQIYNMAPGNGSDINGLSIANDPGSFSAIKDGIDISMNGAFCQGVESIVKRCINE